MSEIFAVQLTAVATLALAVFALATAILAFTAWRKQSSEVRDQAKMLRLQAEEFKQLAAERKREAVERRRAQAQLVYIRLESAPHIVDGSGADGFTVIAHVRNTSRQPIHDLHFYWEAITFDIDEVSHDTAMSRPLMPDDEMSNVSPISPAVADPSDMSVTVTFRDRAGVWWRVGTGGQLEDLSVDSASTGNSP